MPGGQKSLEIQHPTTQHEIAYIPDPTITTPNIVFGYQYFSLSYFDRNTP